MITRHRKQHPKRKAMNKIPPIFRPLRHLCKSATFLFALCSSCALHATGWEIYHKTARPKIDLQIMIPQPSQAVIDADCESRKDVGIGEVILLKILPESLPDIGETEWTLTMKTNGVDAKFHSGNPNDNQSNFVQWAHCNECNRGIQRSLDTFKD